VRWAFARRGERAAVVTSAGTAHAIIDPQVAAAVVCTPRAPGRSARPVRACHEGKPTSTEGARRGLQNGRTSSSARSRSAIVTGPVILRP